MKLMDFLFKAIGYAIAIPFIFLAIIGCVLGMIALAAIVTISRIMRA